MENYAIWYVTASLDGSVGIGTTLGATQLRNLTWNGIMD